ncbi:hypothetical protein ACIO7M_12860 [Streptomyces toxytricini]|uniref:Uncharacterized protein n=1 Tax=Streptomyces toxytricini TaxID=67369 RepID=A0ABW8EFG9_STRT5
MTPSGPDPTLTWSGGDTAVRWRGPAGSVEKSYEQAPRAVMAWRVHDETLVLVVEALRGEPSTPSDNAVVYRADGSELFRLRPPRDLTYDPNDMHGFHDAFPQDGRPLLIMVTRNAGDFRGRIDLKAGRIVDTAHWR